MSEQYVNKRIKQVRTIVFVMVMGALYIALNDKDLHFIARWSLPSIIGLYVLAYPIWATVVVFGLRRIWGRKIILYSSLAVVLWPLAHFSYGALILFFESHVGKAGTQIYSQPTDVRGFFAKDDSYLCGYYCTWALIDEGYEFVEVQTHAYLGEGRFKQLSSEMPYGLYRVSVSDDLSSPSCAVFNSKMTNAEFRRYRTMYQRIAKRGRCLAIEAIEKKQARYSYERQREFTHYWGGKIERNSALVLDLSSGELAIEQNKFNWHDESLLSFHQVWGALGAQFGTSLYESGDRLSPASRFLPSKITDNSY